MSTSSLILAYVIGTLSLLGLAAIYSEMRRRRFEPEPSEDRIFRCSKCGYVYTDDPDVDRSKCSQCGRMNDAFQF
jgi:rubrerythrin